MTLPALNAAGDLPPGLYRARLKEVMERFGRSSKRREELAQQLERIYELAHMTGDLERFIIFGSYMSAKPDPNDIDIILVMGDDFILESCPKKASSLFDHRTAQAEFNASVFWIRPAMLIQEDLEIFLKHWQMKHDGTRRGIVEVVR